MGFRKGGWEFLGLLQSHCLVDRSVTCKQISRDIYPCMHLLLLLSIFGGHQIFPKTTLEKLYQSRLYRGSNKI